MRLLESFILTASTTRAHSTIGADFRPIFAFFRNFRSNFIYKIFYELSKSMKPFLTHKEIICGHFPDIFTQFEFIPFALESPPMEQFSPKFSNGDYVIRDDVIGYPDNSTDSS